MITARGALGGLVALLIGGGLAAGCSDSEEAEEAIVLAKLSEGCRLNTDCTAPLVCVFQRCNKECNDTRDCDSGERCMVGEAPTNVCQIVTECAFNSDCPGGQVCAVDARCRDQCQTDRDCVSGQVCRVGTCADEADLTDDTLERVLEAEEGQPCLYNTDCPEPLACVLGSCRIECLEDRDCTTGLICLDERCALSSLRP